MSKSRFWAAAIAILLCAVIFVTPALAVAIDGIFTDWAGEASMVDSGGADDENSPDRADITEFRANSDATGLFLLKAWDNTSYVGGNATTAGVTVRNASGNYYRVYTTASGNPGSVLLSSLIITSCTDSTCASQTDVCTGAACSGALAGSGTTWVDPFSGRTDPDCTGTNCGTQDTAVELYIPWVLLGGAPGEGQTIFLEFGSYPSGPAQAPKDTTGPNGITCRLLDNVWQCYRSTPTAVTLQSLNAETSVSSKFTTGIVVALALFLLAAFATLRFATKR